MAPKPEKSESGSISCKHGTEGLHGKNIWSVPTFLGSGPIFFCSVNGTSGQFRLHIDDDDNDNDRTSPPPI